MLVKCIEECYICADTCNICADACLGEDGVKILARCNRRDVAPPVRFSVLPLDSRGFQPSAA